MKPDSQPIPPHPPTTAVPAAESLGAESAAARLSFVAGVVLLIVKFIAYRVTRSEAIFSDALESVVNVLASAGAMYAIFLAHRPADRDHPYGHGKIEFVSAGFEGGMILLAALVIAARAMDSLTSHHAPAELDLGAALIALAMLINGALGWFLLWRGRQNRSITLEADGVHLLSDAVTSAVVLTTLVLVRYTGWMWADPIGALAVAVYISFMALRLMRRSAAGLMDEQDKTDDQLLRQILDAHIGDHAKEPRICSYHKLRHRHSGRYHWVDFHIMVPGGWDITEGHRVASTIEYEIELALGEGNATAHVEPCGQPDCPSCDAVAATKAR
jgi:cation diffusion facilitator family transporter